MNYDNWKTQAPETEEHECRHCQAPISSPGYCSRTCYNYDNE